MSDIDVVLGAYPRIHFACRTRRVHDPEGAAPALTAHQAGILGHLDLEAPVMVGELADHLGVTASTMSLNLKRLEEAGFITRARDPDDRRVMNVLLTAEGERMRRARSELDPALVDRMLSTLDPDRRRQAVRGLALLAEAADALVRSRRAYLDALTGG